MALHGQQVYLKWLVDTLVDDTVQLTKRSDNVSFAISALSFMTRVWGGCE